MDCIFRHILCRICSKNRNYSNNGHKHGEDNNNQGRLRRRSSSNSGKGKDGSKGGKKQKSSKKMSSSASQSTTDNSQEVVANNDLNDTQPIDASQNQAIDKQTNDQKDQIEATHNKMQDATISNPIVQPSTEDRTDVIQQNEIARSKSECEINENHDDQYSAEKEQEDEFDQPQQQEESPRRQVQKLVHRTKLNGVNVNDTSNELVNMSLRGRRVIDVLVFDVYNARWTGNLFCHFVNRGDIIRTKLCITYNARSVVVRENMTTGINSQLFNKVTLQIEGGFLVSYIEAHRPGRNLIYGAIDQGNGDGEQVFFKILINVRANLGRDDDIKVNSLSVQTHLARCMGEFENWEQQYEVASKSGFSCIHLTPVTKLSQHGSAYALASTQELEPRIFGSKHTWDDLRNFISRMNEEKSIMTICDIVPNHCSFESQYLKSNPDIAVNLKTHDHLRVAFRVELAMQRATKYLEGTVHRFENSAHKVRGTMMNALASIRLHEFYQFDIKQEVTRFRNFLSSKTIEELRGISKNTRGASLLSKCVDRRSYKRFAFHIPPEKAVQMTVNETRLIEWLEKFNSTMAINCKSKIEEALKNTCAQYHWLYKDPNGPKCSEYLQLGKYPISTPYFTHSDLHKIILMEDYGPDSELDQYLDKNGSTIFLNNGWLMDSNEDFQYSSSQALVRRQLNAWGDLVKLDTASKSYKQFIDEYTATLASTFDGLRLDNCHNTPVWVIKRIIEQARKVRPNCLVLAELFATKPQMDHEIVSETGIDCVVREMFRSKSAGDTISVISSMVDQYQQVGNFYPIHNRIGFQRILPQMLFDQTHDNAPIWIGNLLSNMVSQCMSLGPIGSTRGVDDYLYKKVRINESKRYQFLSEMDESTRSVIEARRELNILHAQLNDQGYTELYCEQLFQNSNITIFTRHNPVTFKRIIAIVAQNFAEYDQVNTEFNFNVTNVLHHNVLLCGTSWLTDAPQKHGEHTPEGHESDDQAVKVLKSADKAQLHCQLFGLNGDEAQLQNCALVNENMWHKDMPFHREFHLKHFYPGSFVIFEVEMRLNEQEALKLLTTDLGYEGESKFRNEVANIVKDYDSVTMNKLLFSVENEEQEDLKRGTYKLENSDEQMMFCGINAQQQMLYQISRWSRFDTLGHPICENIRRGDWLMDYVVSRLQLRECTHELGNLIESISYIYKQVPSYLKPRFFAEIISAVYEEAEKAINIKSFNTTDYIGSVKGRLAMASLQFYTTLEMHKFKITPKEGMLSNMRSVPTLCAGMPHFSTGIFRSWGRDTFVSLKGLLLVHNRFEEAKGLIILYARAINGGLIPNLLADADSHAQYNSRDAVWWWMNAIKEYCMMKGDSDLLVEQVVVNKESKSKSIIELVHQCLNYHFIGNDTLEEVHVDKKTFLIMGGNKHTAGTWMDKCDNSPERVPSTPRDGAAIELQALAYAVLSWLSEHPIIEEFPTLGKVGEAGGIEVTLKEWAEGLKRNVHDCFFTEQQDLQYYKDTFGSSVKGADEKLRPNQSMAMAIAPGLFDQRGAQQALSTVDKILADEARSDLIVGIRTLDPKDPDYRGTYQLGHSTDPGLNEGHSYHNGPEWVWVYAYHMLAVNKFEAVPWERLTKEVIRFLNQLTESPHYSMVELTNSDGDYCKDSCDSQAWSVAMASEFIDYLFKASIDYSTSKNETTNESQE